MWIVIKYKPKNLEILKRDLIKKISALPSFYIPKIKLQKYQNNKLKEYEKVVLDGYLLCYHKDFEDTSILSRLKSTKGFEYVLTGGKTSQEDITQFVNHCKKFEDRNGYLKSTFFSALKTKYIEFLSGPFTKMMFEIISEQKDKIKILIGNSTTTIEKRKYHYQSC
jgi:hypothetical protein|tara:strand:- start:772 stop:1269 length:498 start_codon:yes stop_codon:yes gene_type:complete